MKKSKPKKNTDKTFETRRAAFRAAKRDQGVPVAQHPKDVLRPRTERGKDAALDNRNRRLYIFEILLGLFGKKGKREVHIREDKKVIYPDGKCQEKHFNAGSREASKLKNHYYYKRR